MRSVRLLSIIIMTAMLLPSFDADARHHRRRRRRHHKKVKKLQATAQQKTEYKKLLGKFKWGMSAEKILGMLEAEIRADYGKRMHKERDALRQDAIRREMFAALKKLKANYVKFDGKRTRWSVSMVEDEFAQKNNESMIVRWGKRDRRFFFFHFGKLWKLYIAFNSELFHGKKFLDFVNVMERRFGKGQPKFKLNVKKESVLSHIEWPPAGDTVLKAIDETAFYANFCFVLYDKAARARVLEGRHLNSPKKRTSDPLIDAVTRKGSGGADPNAGVVDDLTGRQTRTPSVGSGSKSSSGSGPLPRRERKRRRKKVDPKDPLGGLDI